MPTTSPATPAPSSPPTPSPTPTPAPAAPSTPSLESFTTDDPNPSPRQTPQKAEAPKAKETLPPEGETDTPAEPAPEKPQTSLGDDLDGLKPAKSKAKEASNGEPTAPKQLREAYEKSKSELSAREKRIAELETAVSKANDEGRKAAETALQAKLDKAIADRDQLESEMRYVKFERTPEYQEKYRKPLDKAYEAAARAIAGIKIQDADGNEVREAKIDDIYSLVQIPSEAQADEAAIALFGKHARTAMKHRDNIVSRIEAMREAQDEWRTKGSERETQMKEEGERATKQFQKWTEEKQRDLAEAAPDYFGEPKDDPEAAALVEKSSAIVDIALGRAKFKDGMSSEDQAKARAEAIGHVVSRARNFGRLVRSNQKLSDENAELKEKLKGYEKSEPTPTPSTAKQEKAPKTPYDALAELAEERH